MLIELNRFMTTEEVRREYRVPAVLVDDILPELPVVVTLEDGNSHEESSDLHQI